MLEAERSKHFPPIKRGCRIDVYLTSSGQQISRQKKNTHSQISLVHRHTTQKSLTLSFSHSLILYYLFLFYSFCYSYSTIFKNNQIRFSFYNSLKFGCMRFLFGVTKNRLKRYLFHIHFVNQILNYIYNTTN